MRATLRRGHTDVRAFRATVQTGVVAEELRLGGPDGNDVRDLSETLELNLAIVLGYCDALDAVFVVQPIDEALQSRYRDDLRDVRTDEHLPEILQESSDFPGLSSRFKIKSLLIFAVDVHGVDAFAVGVVDHFSLLVDGQGVNTFQFEGQDDTLGSIHT